MKLNKIYINRILVILFISSLSSSLFGQSDTAKYYKLSDTTFWVGKTFIIDNILFNFNGPIDGLVHNPESLDSLITFLIKNPMLIVEISNHTDNRPVPMTNDTLSNRRANSVVAELIFKGISPDRLVAVGYGSKRPRKIYENTTYTLNKTYFPKCLDPITFSKNTVLDENFINSIQDHCTKEAAYSLNRRIEIKILKIE